MERRPTCAIIDTGALKHNYFQLRKKISGTTKVMAVVKANAYGHGDVEVAGVLEALGCEFFGVAIAEEGERLRKNRIKSPIVLLGGVCPGQIRDIFELDLTPVVFDLTTAVALNSYAVKLGTVKRIHVKIDTGMGRLGLLPSEVVPFFMGLKGLSNLRLEALLSHFVEAEAGAGAGEYTGRQLELFLKSADIIKGLGVSPEFIDMANSAAVVAHPGSHMDIIRPGIMLYGSYPAPGFALDISLKPVMALKTRILHLKSVPAGFTVSYGRTFATTRESVIATLPIGYADGLPRKLSGRGEVLVRGARAGIAGRVCMDLTMCDVTNINGVAVGDEVVVIGTQGRETITVEEVAGKSDTISYEIFCNISGRVPRVYI
ncbi:MAG: alanine racemase [Deltaproteobacteria bacterium]|nr:alanine racemase [Deltaproteobacteria bacterium]